jgi:hypothetical protein
MPAASPFGGRAVTATSLWRVRPGAASGILAVEGRPADCADAHVKSIAEEAMDGASTSSSSMEQGWGRDLTGQVRYPASATSDVLDSGIFGDAYAAGTNILRIKSVGRKNRGRSGL